MKKSILLVAAALITAALLPMTASAAPLKWIGKKTVEHKVSNPGAPAYISVDKPQVDLSSLPKDKDGYYVIFDGKTLDGWRGYGKDKAPSRWKVENGCIKFSGSGSGEGQTGEGGDLIFAHRFKNFILEFDYKISKGGNSGVLYLAQEVKTKQAGKPAQWEPIYISSPEYQVLDNQNHIDATLGVDGNRKSASLYDMIPAKPQNAKPYGEWNKGRIMVFKGTVIHGQNSQNVLEYHLWTKQWTDMLQASKFSKDKWPLAFELLNNCGGSNHEGYIGFQDHGDDVWFRNIRVRVLDNDYVPEPMKPQKEISVQLYNFRDLIGNPDLYAKNHKEVFQTLAKLGYTSVEAANYADGKLYGVAPEQYKADLEEAGLKSLSSHVGRGLTDQELKSRDFSAAMEWWKQCIAAHKAAGVKYMVVPYIGVPKTIADMQTYCDYFNAVGKLCQQSGILFGYHNHSHEFEKVEGKETMLDYMINHTDPQLVFFQMDVYWAVYGHAAPVEYFKQYPGRFKMLHIKDHYEIGQSGMVGFDAIFKNAATAGLQDYVVEIEQFSTGDWKQSMEICADYLLDAPFVNASYNE